MRKLKLFLGSLMTLALLFVACFALFNSNQVKAADLTEEEKVQADVNAISVISRPISSFPVTTVSMYGNQIAWSSSNEEVLDTTKISETNGWVLVTRSQDEDQTVTLTVTVTSVVNPEASATKTYDVTVPRGTTVARNYNITYVNVEDATHSNPSTYTSGKYVALEPATKDNFVFEGWYKDSTLTKKVTCVPMGSGNITLYAKFIEVELTSLTVEGEVKTAYNAFEAFDLGEAKVYANYSNGSQKELANTEYSVDVTTLTVDVTKVTISYTENGVTKEASVDVTVSPIDVEVTWSGLEYNYSGEVQAPQITAQYLDKDNNPVNVEWTLGEVEFKNAGNYDVTIDASKEFDANYNVVTGSSAVAVISQATLTITADNKTMNQGANIPELTYQVVGLLGNDAIGTIGYELTLTTVATSESTPGDYDIVIEGVGTPTNYTVVLTNATLTIVEAKMVISVENLTFDYDKTSHMISAKVEDEAGADITTESTITYKVNGEDFTGAVDANTYNVVVTATHPSLGSTTNTFNVVVNPKEVTLTWNDPTNLEYDKTEKMPTVTVGEVIEGDSVEATVALQEGDDNINAGTFNVNVTALSSGNYKLPETGLSKSYTITQKEVTLSWEEVTFEYDKTEKMPTVTVGGLIEGDEVEATVTLQAENDNINAGTFTVEATALSSGNYKLPATELSKVYTINQKEVTLSWEELNDLVYDTKAKLPTVTVSGLIEGDEATAEVTLESGNNVNAGTFTAKAINLSNDNYVLPVDATSEEYTIAKKSLSDTQIVVGEIADQERTGSEITPSVTINYVMEGVTVATLVADTDYTLSYSNNVETGIATVTITAADNSNYQGSTETYFIIEANEEDKFNSDIAELQAKYDSVFENFVTKEVLEADKLSVTLTNGSTAQWVSSSTALAIASDGTVTVNATQSEIIELYVTIKNAGETDTYYVTYTVKLLVEETVSNDGVEVTGYFNHLNGVEASITSLDVTGVNVNGVDAKAVYQINGQIIDSVKVSMSVAGYGTYSKLSVYRFTGTGYVAVDTTISGDFINFTTDTLGEFVIVEDKFIVTFNKDNGEANVEVAVINGSTVTEITGIERDGFTFVEWQDAATSTAFDFATPITADITLIAIWTANSAAKTWNLVTDASQLAVGDTIVIAASISNYALGAQTGNYRSRILITKTDGQIAFEESAGVELITLEAGTVAGTFALKGTVTEGYLYAPGGANNLLTQTSINANASWEITVTSEGVATIKSQTTGSRNQLMHNDGATRFSCYASTSTNMEAVAIYKLS